MSTVLYTCCTYSHVVGAIACANSFLKYNDAKAFIFVVDALDFEFTVKTERSHIEFFGIAKLQYFKDTFIKCNSTMSAFELACFAKFVGMYNLANTLKDDVSLIYADSDILFFSSAESFLKPIKSEFEMLFTPHNVDYCEQNSYLEQAWSGSINAGLFAIKSSSTTASKFLERMVRDLFIYNFDCPTLLADQSFFNSNLTSSTRSIFISDNLQTNVAYWNLIERKLETEDDKIVCNGLPLICFHYSGFDENSPQVLSKHAPSLNPTKTINRLIKVYISELFEARRLTPAISKTDLIPSCNRNLVSRIRKRILQLERNDRRWEDLVQIGCSTLGFKLGNLIIKSIKIWGLVWRRLIH